LLPDISRRRFSSASPPFLNKSRADKAHDHMDAFCHGAFFLSFLFIPLLGLVVCRSAPTPFPAMAFFEEEVVSIRSCCRAFETFPDLRSGLVQLASMSTAERQSPLPLLPLMTSAAKAGLPEKRLARAVFFVLSSSKSRPPPPARDCTARAHLPSFFFPPPSVVVARLPLFARRRPFSLWLPAPCLGPAVVRTSTLSACFFFLNGSRLSSVRAGRFLFVSTWDRARSCIDLPQFPLSRRAGGQEVLPALLPPPRSIHESYPGAFGRVVSNIIGRRLKIKSFLPLPLPSVMRSPPRDLPAGRWILILGSDYELWGTLAGLNTHEHPETLPSKVMSGFLLSREFFLAASKTCLGLLLVGDFEGEGPRTPPPFFGAATDR